MNSLLHLRWCVSTTSVYIHNANAFDAKTSWLIRSSFVWIVFCNRYILCMNTFLPNILIIVMVIIIITFFCATSHFFCISQNFLSSLKNVHVCHRKKNGLKSNKAKLQTTSKRARKKKDSTKKNYSGS